jgi:hypothetical protein
MHGAFLRSDYYGASAPPADLSRQRACPPSPDRMPRSEADRRRFPRSPCADRPGRRPATTPAASPRLRRRPSVWPPHRQLETGFGVDRPDKRAVTHCTPGPYPPDLSPVQDLRGFTRIPLRTPSGLACRTRHVWQYRAVPALSGLLSVLTGVPRPGLPSASTRPLRRPGGRGLPPPLGHIAPRGAPNRSSAPPHSVVLAGRTPSAAGTPPGRTGPRTEPRSRQTPLPTHQLPLPTRSDQRGSAHNVTECRCSIRPCPTW